MPVVNQAAFRSSIDWVIGTVEGPKCKYWIKSSGFSPVSVTHIGYNSPTPIISCLPVKALPVAEPAIVGSYSINLTIAFFPGSKLLFKL